MDHGLSDGVVRVRPPRASDVAHIYEAAMESIAEISPWMGWARPELTREEISDYVTRGAEGWATGTMFPMVIDDPATGVLLGSSGLNDVHRGHRRANLGYWVRTSATGRGVATRAARLVAIVGLRDLDLFRIEIRAIVANAASRRVAEKVGASYEGIDRDGIRVRGEPFDAARYSLIRDDLPGLVAAARRV